MGLTITEALAEIKTIGRRIDSKREYIGQFLYRPDKFKDPLEREGGSRLVIERERQSITDLEARLIALRRAIQAANDNTRVTILDTTHTISEWLTWRRDIVPGQQRFFASVKNAISSIRREAGQRSLVVMGAKTISGDVGTIDVHINVNEDELAKEIEKLERTLGELDGQLSLTNATITVSA